MNKKIARAFILCMMFAASAPVSAWAEKGSGDGGSSGSSGGSGSGSGSGSSGSDHSGSSGSGHSGSSGSSDTSGSGTSGSGTSGSSGSRSSDDSGGSRSGGDRHGRGDERTGSISRREDRAFDGGWRERIRNGRYELFDPEGRLVIRRTAKSSDIERFR